MTLKEKMQLLVDKFQTDLPPLLSSASLDNFDNYVNGNGLDSTKKELSVFTATDGASGEVYKTLFVIRCQLPEVITEYVDYYDVINEYIKTKILPDKFGYSVRTKLEGDLFPIEDNTSSSFVFFQLEFSLELDDCEDH